MTVSWADPDNTAGDRWVVSACRTSGWTGTGCSGGYWGRVTAADHPAMFELVSSAPGVQSYWVWVCDLSGSCAGPRSGTFTVAANSGTPAVASATDAPDPAVRSVNATTTVTFTVAWSDPDPGDVEDVFICPTSAGAPCGDDAFAMAWDRTTSPTTLTYTVPATTVGVVDYWAYACDAVGHCSPGYHGTFTAA